MFDDLELQDVIDIGDDVVCDSCNGDYTNSDAKGGGGFGSSAYCPECFPKTVESAKKYGEEKYLKHPKPDQTFREFVLEWRNGDNTIKFYGGKR